MILRSWLDLGLRISVGSRCLNWFEVQRFEDPAVWDHSVACNSSKIQGPAHGTNALGSGPVFFFCSICAILFSVVFKLSIKSCLKI